MKKLYNFLFYCLYKGAIRSMPNRPFERIYLIQACLSFSLAMTLNILSILVFLFSLFEMKAILGLRELQAAFLLIGLGVIAINGFYFGHGGRYKKIIEEFKNMRPSLAKKERLFEEGYYYGSLVLFLIVIFLS